MENNFIITLKLRSSNQVKIFVTDSAILRLSFWVRIVLHIIYGGIANSDQNNQGNYDVGCTYYTRGRHDLEILHV